MTLTMCIAMLGKRDAVLKMRRVQQAMVSITAMTAGNVDIVER